MSIVKKIPLLLLAGIVLNACNTTEGTSQKTTKNKYEYNVGSMVGYSELCSEFQGISASKILLRSLKDHFDENRDFERGYRKQANLIGSDFVSGLDNCETVNAGLEKIGKIIDKQT